MLFKWKINSPVSLRTSCLILSGIVAAIKKAMISVFLVMTSLPARLKIKGYSVVPDQSN